MRLQGLLDDLVLLDEAHAESHAIARPSEEVARRVADLYETCDGWGGIDCLGEECRRCKGSLIVASNLGFRTCQDALTLARYFFGEEP